MRIARQQRGAATGLVALVRYWHAVDGMASGSLHDRAWAMDRASRFVADAGNRNAAYREVRSRDTHDLPAMAGEIVQSDNFWHACALLLVSARIDGRGAAVRKDVASIRMFLVFSLLG